MIAPRRAIIALMAALIALTGCRPPWLEDDPPWPQLILATPPPVLPVPARYFELEPNDVLADAEPVWAPDRVEIVGTIEAGGLDLDLYDLGPAEAGDRVRAGLDVATASGVVLALMDDTFRLLALVDPASPLTGPPEADLVLREPASSLYVLVTPRSEVSATWSYSADVTVDRAVGLPDPKPQVLVLDFDGAEAIRIYPRPSTDIPPFDAANIDSAFAGRTETMIDLIVQAVTDDFAGLDVSIHRAGDTDIPDGERSVVYFGTSDAQLLGLAGSIDPFNADASELAIIYTDSFALFTVLSPTMAQIAQALANVASHEAGHLLGLRHTADPISLMDVTASARQLMLDQWFTVAPLDAYVLPMGSQDAPALLAWTVGGSLPARPAAKLDAARRALTADAGDENDFYIPRSQLMSCSCPDCR